MSPDDQFGGFFEKKYINLSFFWTLSERFWLVLSKLRSQYPEEHFEFFFENFAVPSRNWQIIGEKTTEEMIFFS